MHPTAIIHPSAEIGQGTKIGPYCVIGAGVVLGDECTLHNHVTIEGPSHIGSKNTFYPYGSIGQQTQDLKYRGEPTFLEIGNNNCFREFVTVNRATAPHEKTVIGHHGNFLAYAHIAHDCIVGDHVIFSNNGTLAGHVIVEDYAVIGGLSAVHQFCRIGQYAIVGGYTKIVQDVPCFMIADGNPAVVRGINQVGLERHHFSVSEIRDLREAYKIIYRGSLNTTQAVDVLQQQYPDSRLIKKLLEFIVSSKRGIVR
ncbi:MAG: acyl-[acyl-carrier-protein]--UDP-N-acetylglucosamine O-acyltransferase [Verrucomicrobia bacterium RIFCSPHIGHO2_12_FULL_41_10]|nr:MAG: acyl-[acyl-carrier-protein]--UDP-N-acetylglucosamine O-acyltransferase [Verrucomicrobia bacterium RIFCSPHIGHO2_12_FULL_41_10]